MKAEVRTVKRKNRHEPHPFLDIDNDSRINNMRLTCPYCGGFSRVRNSEWISEKLVTGTLECMDSRCEWSGHFNFSITETTRPCAYTEKARINLGIPYSPFLERKLAEKASKTGVSDMFSESPDKPRTLH